MRGFHTTLPRFACAAVLVLAIACGEKPQPPASKPVHIAPPPTERPAAPAPAAAAPVADAAAPPADAPSPAAQLAKFQMKTDPQSVVTRASSALTYRIDKFKEDNRRWPKSLAEIGCDKLELPPGKRISYNSATGAFQFVDK